MIYLFMLSIFFLGASYIYWLEEQNQTEISFKLNIGDPDRIKAIHEATKNENISNWLFLISMIFLLLFLSTLAYSFA